jgi:hypothetical protein
MLLLFKFVKSHGLLDIGHFRILRLLFSWSVKGHILVPACVYFIRGVVCNV